MMANSSSVNRPGLLRISSGMAILPMSWRAEAVLITDMSAGVRRYLSVLRISSVSRVSVSMCTWRTCIPLSPLRNSTIWLSMSIIRLLRRSFS